MFARLRQLATRFGYDACGVQLNLSSEEISTPSYLSNPLE